MTRLKELFNMLLIFLHVKREWLCDNVLVRSLLIIVELTGSTTHLTSSYWFLLWLLSVYNSYVFLLGFIILESYVAGTSLLLVQPNL